MYLLLFVMWIIFNGNITLEIVIFGLFVSLGVFAFACMFMDHSIKKEIALYKNLISGFCYAVVLVVEIVKANNFVLKMILTQKEEPVPAIVSFRTKLKTNAGRAFLANAITLTPGTITVMMENEWYLVHCLDESLAEGMDDSDFVHRIQKMENRALQSMSKSKSKGAKKK